MITPENFKIKTALISVSDKTRIVDFARSLRELGIEIISTGGTAATLKENNIPVKNISEITGFPEILDGRVKTLHPTVHAGLLAAMDNPSHIKQIEDLGIGSIDLLVVNLYPFEEALKKGEKHPEMIENIDIGGPTMLRAAAKNYLWTAPIINPKRYDEIISILKENGNTLPSSYRAILAGEVFEQTSYYDALIAGYFHKYNGLEFPEKLTLPMKFEMKLRYGENPHQNAALWGNFGNIFKCIHGKELSYNNIVDIDSAARLIIEFEETTLAIVKHTNPCGVATGATLSEAFQKAMATDTVSPYGGIIVVNRIIDKETAEKIHPMFTEVIIAPNFEQEALDILSKKRDRRLVIADLNLLKQSLKFELKSVTDGFLMQNTDTTLIDENMSKVVTARQPTNEEKIALMFAWKVAKHVKSNSIVISTSDRTLGIGAGQTSRVDSAMIAIERAKRMGLDLMGSVMASDAFFPFGDSVVEAAQAGVTAIIQPGGSIHDEEVIKAADEHNISMIFTGMRHFKH
jgi:phosphoribosylaminoimidazolecarboxamide formyltransferase / IMP cyclohydrolase